jgi:hypothetical protein
MHISSTGGFAAEPALRRRAVVSGIGSEDRLLEFSPLPDRNSEGCTGWQRSVDSCREGIVAPHRPRTIFT